MRCDDVRLQTSPPQCRRSQCRVSRNGPAPRIVPALPRAAGRTFRMSTISSKEACETLRDGGEPTLDRRKCPASIVDRGRAAAWATTMPDRLRDGVARFSRAGQPSGNAGPDRPLRGRAADRRRRHGGRAESLRHRAASRRGDQGPLAAPGDQLGRAAAVRSRSEGGRGRRARACHSHLRRRIGWRRCRTW